MDVTVDQSKKMLHRVVLLDVRTKPEYRSFHLADSLHIELSQLANRIKELDKRKEYLVYCRSGSRSDAAVRMLKSMGYKVFNMAGGLIEWTQKGYPIVES